MLLFKTDIHTRGSVAMNSVLCIIDSLLTSFLISSPVGHWACSYGHPFPTRHVRVRLITQFTPKLVQCRKPGLITMRISQQVCPSMCVSLWIAVQNIFERQVLKHGAVLRAITLAYPCNNSFHRPFRSCNAECHSGLHLAIPGMHLGIL